MNMNFQIIIFILLFLYIFYLIQNNNKKQTKQSNIKKTPNPLQDELDLSSESQDQLTAHNAKALILTCMDFRLLDDVVTFMNKIGYNNNYDQFILAGGSLGFNQDVYNDWKKTLNKHINLALELHHIKEIIIIDHMKCSAYKIFYNKKDFTHDEELALHNENINKFKKYINTAYPKLKVKGFIMNLDGSVIKS
jgi:carbonic anhydrase